MPPTPSGAHRRQLERLRADDEREGAGAGAADSTFYNSNGLPEEGHLSSAYDLVQITRAAMAYPEFLDYAGAEGYSIPEGEQNAAHAFLHTDRFLRQDTVYYDETAIAGKTGWTSTAGNCLMTVMQRDGRTLIAVVLQSDSDEVARTAYVDSQTLFDYGFDQFVQAEWTLPAQSEQYSDQSGSTVTLQSGEVSFQCLLPAGAQSSGRLPAVSAGGERGQHGAGLAAAEGRFPLAVDAGRDSTEPFGGGGRAGHDAAAGRAAGGQWLKQRPDYFGSGGAGCGAAGCQAAE